MFISLPDFYVDYQRESVQSCKMRLEHFHPTPLHVHELQPTSEKKRKIFFVIHWKENWKYKSKNTYFCDKAVYETADATIFSDWRTFSDEEKVQVAKVFLDLAARHVAQRCDVHSVPLTYRQLFFIIWKKTPFTRLWKNRAPIIVTEKEERIKIKQIVERT